MKISYAITVCNELKEIKRLIGYLVEGKREQDEIVVLFDSKNGTKEVEEFLDAYDIPLRKTSEFKENILKTTSTYTWYKLHKAPFNNHFADWKNLLTSLCTGDYIYQIDADELINEDLFEYLPSILEQNKEVDVYRVPRINTVEGLTQEHIQKWRWRVDEKGWVNFPDYQWRIYKNNGKIKWKNKVHEVLEGYKTLTALPAEEIYCLIHEKTIERQEKQNSYYDTL